MANINVEMTSADGITLATEGKYCQGNITVAPDSTSKANLIAENIKKDVSILGVTGTLEESSGTIDDTIKLNLSYGETAPTDISKAWVQCAKPNKVTIDDAVLGPPYGSSETTSEIVGFDYAYSNTCYIYNGKRYTFSNNYSATYKCSLRTYNKDSNEYVVDDLTPSKSLYAVYNTSVSQMLQYKDKYRAVLAYGSYSKTYSTSVAFTLTLYNLSLGTSVILFDSRSTSSSYRGKIISLTDEFLFYCKHIDASYSLIKYDIKNATSVTIGNTSSYYFNHSGFYYNKKLYLFTSSTNLTTIDVETGTIANKTVNLYYYASNSKYYYQIDNKLYYQYNGVLKYFDVDTFEHVTVLTLSISFTTNDVYVGSYNDSTLLLCNTTSGGKVDAVISLDNGKLLLRTIPHDYKLLSSDTFECKAFPYYAYFGNSNNEAVSVNVYIYDLPSSRWLFYNYPRLDTPVISITNSTVSWSEVKNATKYLVYSGATLIAAVTGTTVDLSTLSMSTGLNTITLRASCELGYQDSYVSNEVPYIISTIVLTQNGENITWADTATPDRGYLLYVENASDGSTTTVTAYGVTSWPINQLSATQGTFYVHVSGKYTYDPDYILGPASNTITVSNVQNYSVTVNATGENFTLSYDLEDGQTQENNVITGPSSTTVTVHFVANEGYQFKEASYNISSGTLEDISTNSSGDYNITIGTSDVVIDFTVTVTSTAVVQYKLSGSYVFNDTITAYDGSIYEDIEFSDGEQIAYLTIVLNQDMVTYGDTPLGKGIYDSVYYDGTWKQKQYKYINLGNTPQEVSENFYNWFIANATKCTVNGIWQITADDPTQFVYDWSQNVDFKSNDTSYISIHCEFDATEDVFSLYYDDTLVCSDTDGWINTDYEYIEFSSTKQEVSAVFMYWLDNVAQKKNSI